MDKWLKSNAFVKVMSVVLAVLLYIAVNDTPLGIETTNQQTATVIRNVALDAQLDDQRFTVVDMPQTVDLTLRGNSFLLSRVVAGNYRAFVDLTSLGPGIYRNVPVKVEGLPEGIDYVTDPSNVRVAIEEKHQKEVDVQVETVGQPEEGYTLGTPVVSPEKVFVRARESRLKDVAHAKAVVHISNQTETVKDTIELKAYNEAGEIMEDVEVDEPTAEVEVPITSPFTEVPLRPQVKELPPEGYSIDRINVIDNQVTVFGEKGVIEELEIYPGPELDLSGVTKDRTFERNIPLIKGVDSVEPETIVIEVEIANSERKTLSDIPVKLRGIPDGWEADFVSEEDKEVSVTLEGAPDRIEAVERNDVEPYIDLSDVQPGQQEVEIMWDIPPYIKAIGTKKTVRIQLKDGA